MENLNCKICKALIGKLTTLRNSRIFYHCDACGFISLDPKFLLSRDEEKARYDLHENSIDNSGYLKLLQDFVKTAVKPYSVTSVLDYGSGPNPVLAKLLSEEHYDVDIYDPYYMPWDATKKSHYDLVVSTETFEHFQDPVKEFEFITSILKPRGYLAIMTSLACSYENFKAWRYKDDTTHIAFYSMQTFNKLAELFSMEIIYSNDKNMVVLRSKLLT